MVPIFHSDVIATNLSVSTKITKKKNSGLIPLLGTLGQEEQIFPVIMHVT